MKTFCVQLRRCERHPVDRFHQTADEWKVKDGFVMFTRYESEHPVFAIRADLVFSIEVQDDS